MTTVLDLIGRGYFPRELPPPFTTLPLASFVASAGVPSAPTGQRWTKCVSHNLARAGGLRRPLKIPNPRSYIALAEAVVQHWALIAGHLRSAKLSASRPRVTKTLGRALVPRLALPELPKLRARRWRGARYLLRTDIAQFYPSLYTHSIPWALHGKAFAKANLNRTPGDAIDREARFAQDGQTVGIPIGPDSSLLIAEIVLTAVDVGLTKACGPLRGYRYVDDYELAFRTLAEAEAALTQIQGQLSQFELGVNPRKTHIVETPCAIEADWVVDLLRFQIRTHTPRTLVNDTLAFFSHAFQHAAIHRDHGVLAYALRRAAGLQFPSDGWRTFEGLILNAISAEPATFAIGLALLSQARTRGHKISLLALGDVIEAVIARHAPLNHGSEVAFAVWAAIQFGVRLSAAAATSVEAMEDDVVALLALHAEALGRFSGAPPSHARWASLIAQGLDEEHWLLGYEANAKSWIPSPHVASHPFFATLHASGVQFYDTAAASVPMTFSGAAAPIPGGTLPFGYV